MTSPSSPEPSQSQPVEHARSWLSRHPWLGAAIGFVLLLLVLVLFWDWNWFKRPVERFVSGKTGRQFQIDGDLDVDLGRTLTITADTLRLGNKPGMREPEMARTDRLAFDLRVWPMLRGSLQIPRIALDKPIVHLQRDAQGAGNWVFGDGSGDLPEFRNVRVTQGVVTYFEPSRKTDIKIDVDSRQRRTQDAEPPIAIEGGGRWNGNAFTLHGTAESPLELQDSQRPYRIDVKARAGATNAHARGALLDPLRFRGLNLKLALSGKNLADLYPLIGVATPDTPPYSLDGTLGRDIDSPKISTWHYNAFSGKVGDSDLAGDAAVTVGGKRPFLKADLKSARLDLDDLAGFIGSAPEADETTNPELRARAEKRKTSSRVLPDQAYELDKLRAMDANVRLKASRINAPKLPIDDMDAHLYLDDGVLRLEPLDFGVAGGQVRSTIRMDAREEVIRTNADITVRKLDLQALLPTLEASTETIGRVGGEVQLAGNGNSVASMLASSDGSVGIGMGRGRVSNLIMELAGLDIQEALKFLLTKDQQVPIRCAWGDFSVKDGVMTSRGIALDTTDTIIVGEGSISLRDETLDLTLRPRPKDRSLFVFRSPLLIDGSFKDPGFRPDLARVGLRAALAIALANIAPPVALLATFEPGQGEDSDCGGRYAR